MTYYDVTKGIDVTKGKEVVTHPSPNTKTLSPPSASKLKNCDTLNSDIYSTYFSNTIKNILYILRGFFLVRSCKRHSSEYNYTFNNAINRPQNLFNQPCYWLSIIMQLIDPKICLTNHAIGWVYNAINRPQNLFNQPFYWLSIIMQLIDPKICLTNHAIGWV